MEGDTGATPSVVPPVDAILRRVVEALEPCPACVMTRWWDIVAANDAFRTVTGLSPGPRDPRNLLALSFTATPVQERYADWPRVAARLVSDLRGSAARWPSDPRGIELLAQLRSSSPEFVRLWDEPGAHHDRSTRVGLRSGATRLEVDLVRLARSSDEQQSVLVLLPADQATLHHLTRP